MIYDFKVDKVPEIAQVGGKGKALIETSKAGFPVPEGIILSVEFFGPWLDKVKSADAFARVLGDTSKDNCDAVKSLAASMTFDGKQTKILSKAMNKFAGNVFAVRSSSPEEDLEGTSFAGMYETYLGTLPEQMEITVAKAFSSCFDYRVMAYKKQHGINLAGTSIAVVIQRQINSDVSGVGFSLNPLNNSYDEVVINASHGLGEAIVSGIVSPDMYTYDAAQDTIIEKKINNKDIALKLLSDGGIEEIKNMDREVQALSDENIVDLAKLIKKCEEHYGMPMDTEWAYENGKLYLLQSRPITTYIPLFGELQTKPGEKLKYYLDVMILTQGFEAPMSVLGLELWANMVDKIKGGMMTPHIEGTAPALHGRQYLNVTAFQTLVGNRGVKKFFGSYDGNLKRILEQFDLIGNKYDGVPEGTKGSKVKMFKMAMRMLPGVIKSFFLNHHKVVAAYEDSAAKIIERAKTFRKEDEFKSSVAESEDMLSTIMSTVSVLMSGMLSQLSIQRMFKGDDIEKEITSLSMDLSGNPTSAMGHLLFKMACYDEFRQTESRQEFIETCGRRGYSDAFMTDYDEFMEKYAVRGIMEIDVASQRVWEDVGLLYDKLININTEENQIVTVKEKRLAAYQKLLKAAKAKGKEKKFIKAAEKYQATFGYREHPKYLIVYIYGMFHKMCLEMAQEWVEQGRLDDRYHIFDLHVSEVSRAQKDPSFDMREAREMNILPYKRFEHIKNWPLAIDSRGRIYKPTLEIRKGDIVGDPIAPGKVVGKAKVLQSPFEKPLEPGEILIARATEPSWTPIFINASGVIMEIGGPLQHGGIIAREYGIPCVSGLMGIMDIVNDGDMLEVDGYNGVVKLLNS